MTQTLPVPATQVESYTYDTEGNRVASQISAAYVTDPANHVLADAINTYTWSTDGDLTSRTPKNGGVGYNFSSTFVGVANQMRLDSIAGSDGSAISLYYDPFQRLVSRHWPAPRGDDALYYDGPDVVLELRYPSAGGLQWVRYVHGPGMDQPLATEVYPLGAAPTPGAGSQYYYHADGEGSIRLLTDATGAVANRYDYDYYAQAEVTEVEVRDGVHVGIAVDQRYQSGTVHTDIGVRISNFFRAENIEHEIGRVQLEIQAQILVATGDRQIVLLGREIAHGCAIRVRLRILFSERCVGVGGLPLRRGSRLSKRRCAFHSRARAVASGS